MPEETLRPEYPVYGDEIDLRKYVEVLLEGWWRVVGCAVLAAIAAFVVSSLLPPTYEAESGVAIVSIRTDVSFEPRIETVSGEEGGASAGRPSSPSSSAATWPDPSWRRSGSSLSPRNATWKGSCGASRRPMRAT